MRAFGAESEATGGDAGAGAVALPAEGGIAILRLSPPVDAAVVGAAFRDRVRAAVEGGEGAASRAAALADAVRSSPAAGAGGIAICLTSRTAVGDWVAASLAQCIVGAFPAWLAACDRIRAASHEALSNAVLRGNLGIPGLRTARGRELDRYLERVSAALRDDVMAAKPVIVLAHVASGELTVSVQDAGSGFSPTEIDLPGDDVARPAAGVGQADRPLPHLGGRGLPLMRAFADAVAIECGGRRVSLVFRSTSPDRRDPGAMSDFPERAAPAAPAAATGTRSSGPATALTAAVHDQVRNCRILVVDDEVANRSLIGAFLEADGFGTVSYAVDGDTALAAFERQGADLILLDIGLPGIDGLEVCRRIVAGTDEARRPRILMQTAYTGIEERVRSFEAGASDFVTKPLMGAELMARVRMHLENLLLVRSLQEYRRRLEGELELARWMQSLLFPSPRVIDRVQTACGLSIAARSIASSELGGDFWTVGATDEVGGRQPRASLFVCDFSGHGVSAALNAFRLHTLIESLHGSRAVPAARLATLNEQVRSLLPLGQFATVLHCVIDPSAGRLVYTSAAAPRPILFDSKARTARCLEAKGVPLGSVQVPGYVDVAVPMPPGTGLFLYSDALIETKDATGAYLDEDRLCAIVAEAAALGQAEPILDRVLKAFYTGRSDPLPDDLTAVVALRG